MKRSHPSAEAPRPAISPSDQTELPVCLKRLVRTIVRSFYSREHSLIIDLLVSESLFFDAIITLLVFFTSLL